MHDDGELAFLRVLEVRLFWGDLLLGAQYLREGTLAVGDGTAWPVVEGRQEILRVSDRGPEVRDLTTGAWHALVDPETCLPLGHCTASIGWTRDVRPAAAVRGLIRREGAFYIGSFGAHLLALAFVAALGWSPDSERIDQESASLRHRLLAVADEHEPGVAPLLRPSEPEPEATFGPSHAPETLLEELGPVAHWVRERPYLRLGDPLVNGRLPPEVVARIVRQRVGVFRKCYEHALLAAPELGGQIVLQLVIDRDGSVVAATDGGSTLSSTHLTACLVRDVVGLSFPEPGGGIAVVRYPIELAPSALTASLFPELPPSARSRRPRGLAFD